VVGSYGAYQSVSKNAFAFSDFAGVPAGTLYDTTFVAAARRDLLHRRQARRRRSRRARGHLQRRAGRHAVFVDDDVLLSLGARRQQIETRASTTPRARSRSASKDARVTPVAGLVFKATSRCRSTRPTSKAWWRATSRRGPPLRRHRSGHGPARGHVTNGGQAFKPYQTRQGEIGVKVDTGRYGGTVSVFSRASRTTPRRHHLFESARQRNQRRRAVGLRRGDARRARAGRRELPEDGAAGPGRHRLAEVASQPRLDFDVPGVIGLALVRARRAHGEAVRRRGQHEVVPSWTRFDIGGRYAFDVSGKVTLRAGVDNVAGRNYWASAGGYPGQGYLTVGAPRTFVRRRRSRSTDAGTRSPSREPVARCAPGRGCTSGAAWSARCSCSCCA
jgi:iron complex outermembrane receptor protein